MNTCATCEHWNVDKPWQKKRLKGEEPPTRAHCPVLCEIVDDDDIDHIELPHDFGCNKWEAKPPEQTATL